MSDDIELPRAHDAEEYCIGCLVAFPDRADEVFTLLTATDFVDVEHRKIFAEAQKQYAAGGIDPPLLGKVTGQPRILVNIGIDPANAPTTTAHIAAQAAKIVEARRKRQLIELGESIVEGGYNGRLSGDICRTAIADLGDFQREAFTGKHLLADAVSVGEFVQQEHQVEYLVPNVLVAGQAAVMSARSKSLKTTTVCDLNISLGMAAKFLNYWQVPEPVKCGMLSAESGAATLSETFQRIAWSKGIDPRTIENCIISTRCPRLRLLEWQLEVRRFIEDNELRCLTIDPTYLAMAGVDQNNLASMGDELTPLTDIIRETGCSILMVHHNRKLSMSPFGCPTLEEITGSGFAEWARCWLLLNKRREWDEETGRHWLWFVAGGSAGFGCRKWLDVHEGKPSDPGGRVWNVEVVSAIEGERSEQQSKFDAKAAEVQRLLNEDREAVFKLLNKHPSGASKTFIRDMCGVSSRRWPMVFAAMCEAGELVPCEITVSNHKTPKTGFKLSQ